MVKRMWRRGSRGGKRNKRVESNIEQTSSDMHTNEAHGMHML